MPGCCVIAVRIVDPVAAVPAQQVTSRDRGLDNITKLIEKNAALGVMNRRIRSVSRHINAIDVATGNDVHRTKL
ncbi:MAG: hypothetical protein ACYSW3_09185 [Planctomycetota bacterium]